jgi:hypothetical protein
VINDFFHSITGKCGKSNQQSTVIGRRSSTQTRKTTADIPESINMDIIENMAYN